MFWLLLVGKLICYLDNMESLKNILTGSFKKEKEIYDHIIILLYGLRCVKS